MNNVIVMKKVTKEFRTSAKTKKGIFRRMFSGEYNVKKAVNSINCNIKEGELVGFIGPNGAGKSTTIKMLSGILFPTSGEIKVLGLNPQKERIRLAYNIGTIFGQRQQLSYHLPPRDSFKLFAAIYDIDDKVYKERLDKLVKLFQIEKYIDVPVRKLSLGERMRCEFVASLLHNPRVLFLDEPTIGLDIIAKKKLREYIRLLNEKQKTTIILTSHDLSDIEELCDRVVIINHGSILYDGSIKEIRKRVPFKRLEILFADEMPKIRGFKHANIISQEPYRVVLEVDMRKVTVKQILKVLLANYSIEDIVIEEPPIEEIIETFYK